MAHNMESIPHFGSEDELRDWFDSVDPSTLNLVQALDVIVANHVELSLDESPALSGNTGTTGTISGFHLVHR